MTAYVLDASVAAKWFLPSNGEPLAAESIGLLDSLAKGRIHASVPDLFWPEIGIMLWKAARPGRISEQTAHQAIALLKELKVSTVSTVDLLPDAALHRLQLSENRPRLHLRGSRGVVGASPCDR